MPDYGIMTEMDAFCFDIAATSGRAVTRAFNLRPPLNLNIARFILLGVVARGEDRSVAAVADGSTLSLPPCCETEIAGRTRPDRHHRRPTPGPFITRRG